MLAKPFVLERKRRLGSEKSKTGCLTCRIRRVKCDESKPHCRKCLTTGRQCEGPVSQQYRFVNVQSSWQNNSYQISLAQQSPTWNFDGREARAFDFFLHQAAPLLSGALDSEFWARFVPQLSQSEPMVWNAVLAISAFCEHPRDSLHPIELVSMSPVVDQYHQQALKWYNKAISHFRRHIQQKPHDSSLTLLSCTLFICIEFHQENIANALALLGQGLKLLPNISPASKTVQNHCAIHDIVVPFFQRHAVLASIFGTSDWFSRVDERMLQFDLAFVPLRDVKFALYMLMEHCHAFFQMAGVRLKDHDTVERLVSLRDKVLSNLMGWQSVFSQLDCSASVLEIFASSNLLMYHSVAIIWMSTSLSNAQIAFDQYHDQFDNIVHHANIIISLADTQPSFTFEMGFIPPLYFVATECRDPTIRRRALALLTRARGALYQS